MYEERIDWQLPPYGLSASRPRASVVHAVSSGAPLSARRRLPGTRRRVARLADFLAWRVSRRQEEEESLGLSYEQLLELDAGNVRCGLSKEEISDLRDVVVERGSEWDCSDACCHICLEAFDVGECLVVLKCRHAFHRLCGTTWLKQKRSCPICRCEL